MCLLLPSPPSLFLPPTLCPPPPTFTICSYYSMGPATLRFEDEDVDYGEGLAGASWTW